MRGVGFRPRGEGQRKVLLTPADALGMGVGFAVIGLTRTIRSRIREEMGCCDAGSRTQCATWGGRCLYYVGSFYFSWSILT